MLTGIRRRKIAIIRQYRYPCTVTSGMRIRTLDMYTATPVL